MQRLMFFKKTTGSRSETATEIYGPEIETNYPVLS